MAFDWLKNNFDAAKKRAQEEITKYKNADFMHAVIAACAKVAYADGVVDPKEKQKMMQYIQVSDELKVFKPEEVIASWNAIAGKFDFDLEIGSTEALKTICKLRSKPDAARTLVRVALIIANSDGNFDVTEKKAAREICSELGIDPTEFELN